MSSIKHRTKKQFLEDIDDDIMEKLDYLEHEFKIFGLRHNLEKEARLDLENIRKGINKRVKGNLRDVRILYGIKGYKHRSLKEIKKDILNIWNKGKDYENN